MSCNPDSHWQAKPSQAKATAELCDYHRVGGKSFWYAKVNDNVLKYVCLNKECPFLLYAIKSQANKKDYDGFLIKEFHDHLTHCISGPMEPSIKEIQSCPVI